ncbi:MAG TPA: MoxR family ATPase [Firmicutes bacterium]|nr:MoxR family ATPase [Bacillota bacterium]
MNEVEAISRLYAALAAQVHKVVVGQDQVLQQLVAALLAGGHVLVEGVPGTAKTLLARALGRSLELSFGRIQFTPDMLPADITGTHIYAGDGRFRLQPGPIFNNLVLADEINRTPPRTQAALLEAMQEAKVTLNGETIPLPQPFMVIATENPVEFVGTYPLPEAALDRFMVRITIAYPAPSEEVEILQRLTSAPSSETLLGQIEPVATAEDVAEARRSLARVVIRRELLQYAAQLVAATRQDPRVRLGASPRAGVLWLQFARAMAALQGRDFLTPDDLRDTALQVLGHRLLLYPDARLEGDTVRDVIDAAFSSVEVPR